MTMMVKISINQMEQRKFGLPTQKPTNVRLHQCVPGKTKIKANKLEYINGKFYANVWQKMPLLVNPHSWS
jgi:glutamine cyclotransferase